jgi:hypothetical protein
VNTLEDLARAGRDRDAMRAENERA